MIDCAVLIAAQELGLFARQGLNVVLSREIGWASVREKLLHDELHAVHAPASLAFVIRCGIGIVARPCLTAFVLSLNGSAITLSRELWEKGVRDAASLKALIDRERAFRTYRLGAVHEFSTQHYDLRRWLCAGGIDPDRDIQMPIIPSPVIHRGLLDGHLDGYCVAEPWNSVVTESGDGWVVATASQLAPNQPEKVLLVLEKFVDERPEEHLALVAALPGGEYLLRGAGESARPGAHAGAAPVSECPGVHSGSFAARTLSAAHRAGGEEFHHLPSG